MGSSLRRILRRLKKIESNMHGLQVKQEVRIENINDRNPDSKLELTKVQNQLEELIQLLSRISVTLGDIKNTLK